MKVILFSGGIDSLLLALNYPDAHRLHIEYGQTYSLEEEAAILRLQQVVGPVDTVQAALAAPAAADGHVPHRNLLLAVTAAAARPQATEIMLGGVRGETSRDKSGAFLRATSRTLSRSEGGRVRLTAPLRRHTKAEWLRILVDMEGEVAAQTLVDLTSSCYDPRGFVDREIGCGECLACFRRWVALERAGLQGSWEHPPWQRPVTTGEALGYLRHTRPAELPGVIVNQYDALRALRRKR